MIKKLHIRNFRCLRNVTVNFEVDQTLIVGENDAGKTSLVDIFRILFNGKSIEANDFSYGQSEIEINVDIENRSYYIKYIFEDNTIAKEVKLKLTNTDLVYLRDKITSEDFTEENSLEEIKEIAKIFNISVRSNSRFDSLKETVNTIISEKIATNAECIIESILPSIKLFILDGKHMDDISLFVNERYFKDKKNNIWDEHINTDFTIEQFVVSKLHEHSDNIKNTIEENGIVRKIQEFLPELTDIKINTTFTRKDINIGVSVLMLHGDEEISISKKGDGTKRRITLALLGIDNTEEDRALYIFDEVDTHLHVKAQKELMKKISDISSNDNQVILTSHSPFIINTVKPKQIRSIINHNNSSEINSIETIENIDTILSNLGIENIYLFFAKKILLVEGKTEEVFLPSYFEKNFNSTFHNNLVKVINVDGIRNIPGFARALTELNKKENIFILTDNDIEDDTQRIIDQLDLDTSNVYKVGQIEFEDSFDSNTIYNAWKSYVENNNRAIGTNWTESNIENCLQDCLERSDKFSKKLKEFNSGCAEKLTKPKLGVALAEYCTIETTPSLIVELINKLVE